MRRLVISLLISVLSLSSFAQTSYKAYAEIVGSAKGLFSNKVKVSVDFGQSVSFWKPGDMRLVDDNGKDIVFNSMVDAMNFMGKCGWQFVQAYVITEGGSNVYHWLLSKDVANEDEIKEGFKVRTDNSGRHFADDTNTYYIEFAKRYTNGSVWEKVKDEVFRDVSPEKLQQIIDDWKAKTTESTVYDCKVQRVK